MASEDSKKDPAWKYGHLANPAVKNNVTCKFCSKEGKGGIFRLKQHLVGGFRNITACPTCPEHVKEEIGEYMLKKKSEKKHEEQSENAIIGNHGKRIVRVGNSSNKKSRQVGPTDDSCKKELRDEVCANIERLASIPFNAITLDICGDAIESLVRYGMAMNLASFDEVTEEVEFLRKHLNSMKQNGGKEEHIFESRSLRLKFSSNLSLLVFTGARIEGEDCSNLQVALVDASTGQTVIGGPESSAKVEIVVLEGDFDGDENDNWTVEEFKNNVVREREGKEPLLTGDAFLNLKEGIGLVGEISFTDNSSWTRSRRFRIGARVVDNTDGTTAREAKTESFIVEDHSGELYKKHYPPSLLDEVWRLENIDKDGAFHKHLSRENINTVKDFLILLIDAPRLQKILGTGMSAEMWEVTVDHARTCVVDKGMFLYRPSSSQQKTGVVFNVMGQVMGILSECQYVTIDKLSETEKVNSNNLLISALDHWVEVVTFDDEASLVGSSSQLTNVPYTARSPSPGTESPNWSKFVYSPIYSDCYLDDYALRGDEDYLQSALDDLLARCNAFAIDKAQKSWTMLFFVLKCRSVRKSVNLKKTTLLREIQI